MEIQEKTKKSQTIFAHYKDDSMTDNQIDKWLLGVELSGTDFKTTTLKPQYIIHSIFFIYSINKNKAVEFFGLTMDIEQDGKFLTNVN